MHPLKMFSLRFLYSANDNKKDLSSSGFFPKPTDLLLYATVLKVSRLRNHTILQPAFFSFRHSHLCSFEAICLATYTPLAEACDRE